MLGYESFSGLQQKAYDLAARPRDGQTIIKGYAGTGKTTVLVAVAKELAANCIVLAPTNKAANNMKDKGIKKAATIHSVLYSPQEVEIYKKDKNGDIVYHMGHDGKPLLDDDGDKIPYVVEKKLSFVLRDADNEGDRKLPRIALIDEASMISEDVYDDLLRAFPCCVFFGDGFQLPPVKSRDVFAHAQADVFLDEVHRVALENPIIRYATDIREGKEPRIESIDCHEIRHCSPHNTKLYQAIVANDVQAISYRNRTRHEVNEAIRKERGYQLGELNVGESIVCLQNVRETKSENGRDVERLIYYNGQICIVKGDYKTTKSFFHSEIIHTEGGVPVFSWPFWNPGFFGLKEDYQKWNTELDRRKASTAEKPIWGKEFDYAYCLTAHKAQGSEFKNVCVFDERASLRNVSQRDKERWYYTAITRAKERLLIVK